jgi:hypothetical protein
MMYLPTYQKSYSKASDNARSLTGTVSDKYTGAAMEEAPVPKPMMILATTNMAML